MTSTRSTRLLYVYRRNVILKVTVPVGSFSGRQFPHRRWRYFYSKSCPFVFIDQRGYLSSRPPAYSDADALVVPLSLSSSILGRQLPRRRWRYFTLKSCPFFDSTNVVSSSSRPPAYTVADALVIPSPLSSVSGRQQTRRCWRKLPDGRYYLRPYDRTTSPNTSMSCCKYYSTPTRRGLLLCDWTAWLMTAFSSSCYFLFLVFGVFICQLLIQFLL